MPGESCCMGAGNAAEGTAAPRRHASLWWTLSGYEGYNRCYWWDSGFSESLLADPAVCQGVFLWFHYNWKLSGEDTFQRVFSASWWSGYYDTGYADIWRISGCRGKKRLIQFCRSIWKKFSWSIRWTKAVLWPLLSDRGLSGSCENLSGNKGYGNLPGRAGSGDPYFYRGIPGIFWQCSGYQSFWPAASGSCTDNDKGEKGFCGSDHWIVQDRL